MLGYHDREYLVKAVQTADALVSDLRVLEQAEDPFLAEIAYDLIKSADALKSELHRLMIRAG